MAANMISETRAELNELFEYRKGFLYRKKCTARRHKAGQKVGHISCGGYMRTTIKQKNHLVHRIIFKMVYGYEPKIIDHINGNPLDNRIENIQEIDRSNNKLKGVINKNNTTGVKGVTFCNHYNKYVAKIHKNGKSIHLGYHDILIDAKKARLEAEKIYITCWT